MRRKMMSMKVSVLLWLNDSVCCYSENLSVVFTVNILELNLM